MAAGLRLDGRGKVLAGTALNVAVVASAVVPHLLDNDAAAAAVICSQFVYWPVSLLRRRPPRS